jgi:hypothetical protein
MQPDRSETLAEPSQVAAEFEGELRDVIRSRDVTFLRTGSAKPAGDANNLNSLIHRVAGTSTYEIDILIEQLRDMREFLRNESERISQEIAGYAQASQNARAQVETITEQLAQWRTAIRGPSLTHD